jgi:hypothetical protein
VTGARLLAEFESAEALERALQALRQRGYRNLDAYTPYSTESVREALGPRRSPIPWQVLIAGLLGGGGAYALQWYLVAFLYPLNVGARPPHMPLAFVPITFEMAVLAASVTAFVTALWYNRLLRWWDPVFEVEGFESASADRFWLELRGDDPVADLSEAARIVQELGPTRQVLTPGEAA